VEKFSPSYIGQWSEQEAAQAAAAAAAAAAGTGLQQRQQQQQLGDPVAQMATASTTRQGRRPHDQAHHPHARSQLLYHQLTTALPPPRNITHIIPPDNSPL